MAVPVQRKKIMKEVNKNTLGSIEELHGLIGTMPIKPEFELDEEELDI